MKSIEVQCKAYIPLMGSGLTHVPNAADCQMSWRHYWECGSGKFHSFYVIIRDLMLAGF